LIPVDDGSTDGSGGRCDEWGRRDERVRVIQQANAGQSAARDRGVRHSTGEWIAFVDADGYVAADYLEYLSGLAGEYGAGISMCLFSRTHGEPLSSPGKADVEVFNRSEACERMVMIDLDDAPWCKLYRRDLVVANPFPEGRVFEDTVIMGRLFYEAGRVVRGKRTLYAYFQREGSTVHVKNPKAWRDQLQALKESAEFFDVVGEDRAAAFAWERVRASVQWAMAEKGLPLPEIRAFWRANGKRLNVWTAAGVRCRLRMAAPWLFSLRNLARGKAGDRKRL